MRERLKATKERFGNLLWAAGQLDHPHSMLITIGELEVAYSAVTSLLEVAEAQEHEFVRTVETSEDVLLVKEGCGRTLSVRVRPSREEVEAMRAWLS